MTSNARVAKHRKLNVIREFSSNYLLGIDEVGTLFIKPDEFIDGKKDELSSKYHLIQSSFTDVFLDYFNGYLSDEQSDAGKYLIVTLWDAWVYAEKNCSY